MLPLIQKNPIVGAAIGAGATAISFLEEINIALRVLSGAGALVVTILTIILQLRKLRKR